MKIGIYGDSYASSNSEQAVKWFELVAAGLEKMSNSNKKSWLPFLKKDKPLYDLQYGEKNTITLYSLAGSSFFYTYTKFLETYKDNDLNIVLVTDATRYSKFVNLTSVKFNHVITGESHIDALIKMYGEKLTPIDKNKLIHLRGWFRSVDEEYHKVATDLMLDNMEKLHKNTIFFPSFSGGLITKEREQKQGIITDMHYMHSFWIRQLELLNLPIENLNSPETGNLCGHLGPEFNEFFANMVLQKIKTGVWNHDGFMDIKLKNSLPFYYKVENE